MRALWLGLFLTLAMASLYPASAWAYGSCTDDSYIASFAAGLPHQTAECDTVDSFSLSWNGRRAAVRLIKQHGASLAAQTLIVSDIREVIADVGAALDQMGDVQVWPISIMLTGLNPPRGEPAHAWGPEGECTISFFKLEGYSTQAAFKAYLAHELFHCVQFATWPGKLNRASDWWVEGSATWFAYLAEVDTTIGDSAVADFDALGDQRSLVDMTYETVVFFTWIAQNRNPQGLTAFLGAMADADGRQAQIAALRASIDDDAWLQFEDAYLGQALILPGGRALPSTPLPGAYRNIVHASGDTHVSYERPEPFVVHIARLDFEPNAYYQIPREAWNPAAPMHWRQEPMGVFQDPPGGVNGCDGAQSYSVTWAQSAPTTPQPVVIDAHPLEARCPCEREGVCPESGGAGSDYGEPHLVTFDGRAYDFQVVGEFVLTRSPYGFEVQTRQEQLRGLDTGAQVSVNTALAMRAGAHRIAFYAHDFAGVPVSTSRFYLDGAPTRVGPDGLDVGGAHVSMRGDDGYDIAFATGASVGVDFYVINNQKYLDLRVNVPPGNAGLYQGLMGDADGEPANDLKLQDGAALPGDPAANGASPSEAEATRYADAINHGFADSWRVSQSNSLFDYARGQSTATFTDRSFPSHALTLAHLDANVVAAAEAACQQAGVDASTMRGCVFDVAASGHTGFAHALGAAAQTVRDRALDAVRSHLPSLPIPIPHP